MEGISVLKVTVLICFPKESYDLTPSTSKTAASKKEPSALSSPVPCSSSSLMMSPEQLIDQIAKHQSYRMNDQRSEVNLLPGLTPSPRNQQVLGGC